MSSLLQVVEIAYTMFHYTSFDSFHNLEIDKSFKEEMVASFDSFHNLEIDKSFKKEMVAKIKYP